MECVVIKDAAAARLATCVHCHRGFRRQGGIHVGSQRLGMIPDVPCETVFAARGEGDDAARPWIAHVDGEVLRKTGGEARRFASARAAYAAACAEVPRKWHP
jgi:hypothetical protein